MKTRHPSRCPLFVVALLLWLSAARAQQLAQAPDHFCQADALASLLGQSLQLQTIDVITPGQWPEDLPPPGDVPEATLQRVCRVKAVASAGEDSQINMEVWLPAPGTWNGKLVGTGNGGYNPALSYNDMMMALRRGYAVVGGDTGHSGRNGGDVSFGRGHPEKIRDWGERSIHVITVAAKQMIVALMQQAPARSYYYGCSTGGHQGLAEAQRYPADYDGIIAGDPANNRIRWSAQSLWLYQANHLPGDNKALVTQQQMPLIRDRVMEKCDALDGRRDGVIEDPRQCTWSAMDFAALACKDGNSGECLSGLQITALEKIYQGLRNPRTGEQLYPGLQPGSENGWGGFLGNNPARGDFWRYWVDDSDEFDVWKFDFVDEIRKADLKLGAVVDSINPDLSQFHNRGGKLIVYHGWADPSVSPIDSINYHDKVVTQMGAQAVDEFYRLFVVPGMGHCGGGPGATVFGNAALEAPQPDIDNDMLNALDHWVETQRPLVHLHSVEIRDDAVVSTRLLCSWPEQGGPGNESCQAGKYTAGAASGCQKNILVATADKGGGSSAVCLNSK